MDGRGTISTYVHETSVYEMLCEIGNPSHDLYV